MDEYVLQIRAQAAIALAMLANNSVITSSPARLALHAFIACPSPSR
jgi:hypothetical protein